MFYVLSSVLWLRLPCKPGTHLANLPVCRVQSGDFSPWGSGFAGRSSRCHGHQRRQAEVYGHAQPDLLSSCMLWLSAPHGRWGEPRVFCLQVLVYFLIFTVLYVKSFQWSSLSVLIPGVSGECTAARSDRAPDAPPPAAVSPGHAEDRKWRGERVCTSQRVEGG